MCRTYLASESPPTPARTTKICAKTISARLPAYQRTQLTLLSLPPFSVFALYLQNNVFHALRYRELTKRSFW